MADKTVKGGLTQAMKIWILVLSVLALLLLVFSRQIIVGLKKILGITPPPVTTPPATNKPPVHTTTSDNTAAFPLKQGSAGDEVKNLQLFLNANGGYGLTVDGQFGPATLAAVQEQFGATTVTQAYYDQFVIPYLNGQTDSMGDPTIQGNPMPDENIFKNVANWFTAHI